MKPKTHRIKLGTMPAVPMVVSRGRLRVGATVLIRDTDHGSKPISVTVDKCRNLGGTLVWFCSR